ncbi:hypothetical protein ACFXJ5_17545 [Streptomyces sp. NPDC059373]
MAAAAGRAPARSARGKRYVDSARHATYVDTSTYQSVLADACDRFGTGDVTEGAYDGQRPAAAAPATVTVP